jgi:hypothetical protein
MFLGTVSVTQNVGLYRHSAVISEKSIGQTGKSERCLIRGSGSSFACEGQRKITKNAIWIGDL